MSPGMAWKSLPSKRRGNRHSPVTSTLRIRTIAAAARQRLEEAEPGLGSGLVCLGTLTRVDDHFVEMQNADLHDLRDTGTSRENYTASSRATGIKRNRKRLLLLRSEIVAVARLEDVVDD